jgi:hypothetical protein
MTSPTRRALIDDLMDAYVDWREECIGLREAYDRWSSGSADERSLAFAAYGAALDREQLASFVYAERAERVARLLKSNRGPLRRLWRSVRRPSPAPHRTVGQRPVEPVRP